MDGYVTKPIWPEALFAALNDVRKPGRQADDDEDISAGATGKRILPVPLHAER
jgi:hypothetical protein